jgi:hypothetical protein
MFAMPPQTQGPAAHVIGVIIARIDSARYNVWLEHYR